MLEQVAREASRFGSTGALAPDWLPPPAPATREDAVRRVVLWFGPHVLNADHLTLRVTAYAGPAALASPTPGQAGAGAAGETVLYELTYNPSCRPFRPCCSGAPRSTTPRE